MLKSLSLSVQYPIVVSINSYLLQEGTSLMKAE